MLNVTFEEKEGKITLTLKGHAGQAEIGQDIVCASCSILAYTVAQLVTTAEGLGKLKTKPKIKLEVGDGIISCEPTEKAYGAVKRAYYFAEVGYTLLSQNFPQFVEVKRFGAV